MVENWGRTPSVFLCCHTPTRASGSQVQEEMGNSCQFPSMPYSGKIKFQDAEPPRTLKKDSTRVGFSQVGTEERLNDPSQKKPRPWAAGVARRERSRPGPLGFLEPSNSPVPTQAEEEGSGYTSPEA